MMNLVQLRAAVRTLLKDSGTVWSDGELDSSVERAVTDIDRFFPKESVYEIILSFEVKDEAWTAAASPGTWVTLANKPIAWNSETVKDSTGATAKRNTDYKMDYMSGKITHIAGGIISNSEACTISYDKSKLIVDVSSLSIIRITHIEYPYGEVPQSFSSYEYFSGLLWLTGIEVEAQANLKVDKHLIVYYLTTNIFPTVSASGSYPRHLDNIVIKGAAAYSCFIKSFQYRHQVDTDLASARAELAAISQTALGTALTDARARLVAGITALGNTGAVHTAAQGALTDARTDLTAGKAKINTVNTGDGVPENYRAYAQAYINEASERFGEVSRYLEESTEQFRLSSGYLTEADRRLEAIRRYIEEATGYISIAAQMAALADRFYSEGQWRLNEFLTVLSDRAQLYGKPISTPSPRQVRT